MFPPTRLKAAMTLGGLSTKELTVRTWRAINDHEIQTRAAAVSFYAMLALVPFLGLVLTLAVQLLPDLTGSADPAKGIGDVTVEEFRSTLKRALPREASDEIERQISRLQSEPHVGLISIGLAITIWLSSSLYVAVIDAINRINGVTERRGFFHLRMIAIVMTLVEAFILVGSLLVIVGWNWILDWLKLGSSAAILATITLYLTILMMVLLSFALTFFIAPDAEQKWEWITPGSILGAILFLAATYGFRIYVQNFANYNRTYGPLGGVMVLLFWFWISSLILLGAAQVNRIIEEASPLGKNYGQRVNVADAPDFDAMEPVPVNP
jgi:membrane protein